MSLDDTLSPRPRLLRSAAVLAPRSLLPFLVIALGASALLVQVNSAQAGRRSLRYRLPADAIETLSFDVAHTVQTSFDQLPPEAEPYDTDTLQASLATVTTEVSGTIERVVGRVFRDRSLGLVSRVIDVAGSVDRGQGAEPLDASGIEGKSVSMRVLESGELLASAGWQHLAGGGRGGDAVFTVLLQSILRLPFEVPSNGGTLPTSFKQRVPVDPLLNLDQTWDLLYSAAEVPDGCGRRCVAVSYEGTITEAAVDGHPARPMKRDGAAQVSGTILLDSKSGYVRDHTFKLAWTFTTTSLRENGTPRAVITQLQTTKGRVFGGARK